MKLLKKILLFIVNITWCLPQNLLGLCVYLWALFSGILRGKRTVNGKIEISVNDWALPLGSLSLGEFRFICHYVDSERREDTIYHEFGHTIQSYIFGPLFLIIFGLPSIIWANFFSAYRIKHNIDYDSFYTEKFATYLGNKFRG